MEEKQIKKLLELAQQASRQSYSPYSKLKVGAALLASNGTIYLGANVENSSYGLCICAERVAVFKAVTSGHRQFDHIAIFVDSETIVPPCGACLQVLAQFAHGYHDLPVTCGNEKSFFTKKLSELYPHPFIF